MTRVSRHTGLTVRGSISGIGVVVGVTTALVVLFLIIAAAMTLVAE